MSVIVTYWITYFFIFSLNCYFPPCTWKKNCIFLFIHLACHVERVWGFPWLTFFMQTIAIVIDLSFLFINGDVCTKTLFYVALIYQYDRCLFSIGVDCTRRNDRSLLQGTFTDMHLTLPAQPKPRLCFRFI